MAENNLDHLFLGDHFHNANDYKSSSKGGTKVLARSNINREDQGNFIKVRFNEAINDFNEGKQEQDFAYIELTSAINFEIDIEKFDGAREIYRIAYIHKNVIQMEDGSDGENYTVGLYVSKSGMDDFLVKIDKFLTEYTHQSKDKANPTPQFNSLIANLEDIKAATLRSFWQEHQFPFPEWEQEVWWEIWIDNKDIINQEIDYLTQICQPYGVQIGNRWLRFPEHSVGLIKGSPKMLSLSVLHCNKLAELRKPKDTSDFFTTLNRVSQNDWIEDLKTRTINRTADSKISVCLLDTGVNRGNPLLEDLIPEYYLDTIIPSTGKSDTGGLHGHGTPMAGLILYGNLTDALASSHQITIYHHLESIKLISPAKPHDPLNYGAVTQEAIDRALIMNVDHKRVVCLAVTSNETEHLGTPSSWSAALDQYSFGGDDYRNESTLICVSTGNLTDELIINYPLSNHDTSIEDPAQALNALTVGAYTDLDHIDPQAYPEAQPLAKKGGLSPSSSTSFIWDNGWGNKPDIVMEGGNHAIQHDSAIRPDSLQLLSTAKGSTLNSLTTFGDSSAATALASRFAAQLYVAYPKLWPETIRALTVYSADWTPTMLQDRSIKELSSKEKICLLKSVGYGVPNLTRAMKSSSNALTLISETELKPYKIDGSTVKTDKFHLYTLPWPVDVLGDLLNTQIKLTVTLSYFIEPNPGNKRYVKANNYMSHALRFKMIDINEGPEAFAGRISTAMREEDYTKEGRENGWLLGGDIRNKGSIHKDIWEGNAADLATRNMIAIYPITGWWKNRKKLKRYENTVRYSLIISIEAPDIDVDIYNPVKQQIDVKVSVPVEIHR